jgi:hypothetical protein
MTEPAEPIQLLLDEMFLPRIAEALRERGYKVVPLVEITSGRTFPRSRQHIGPVVDALDAWLAKGPPEPPIIEGWLQPV